VGPDRVSVDVDDDVDVDDHDASGRDGGLAFP